jgi:formate/nitrite transporter FocA (FNT family)
MSEEDPDPVARPDETQKHWLTQASTIRGLWWTGGIVLVLVTLADLVISRHAAFTVAETFGFYSWYGFATCALMVFVAKALGAALKRGDDYYEP